MKLMNHPWGFLFNINSSDFKNTIKKGCQTLYSKHSVLYLHINQDGDDLGLIIIENCRNVYSGSSPVCSVKERDFNINRILSQI